MHSGFALLGTRQATSTSAALTIVSGQDSNSREQALIINDTKRCIFECRVSGWEN
jgi:hypothetical protein